MRVKLDYIIDDSVVKIDEIKYIKKYKIEVNNIVEYIILNELFNIYEIEGLDISSINSNIKDINVSITFVSSQNIQLLNKEYRNVDRVTDVLSFPIQEGEELNKIKLYINEEKKEGNYKNNSIYNELLLGDIIICLPKIIEQAEEYEHSVERELMYMIVHGMYHLLSYDHIENEDKKLMREKEEFILNKFKYGVEGERYAKK